MSGDPGAIREMLAGGPRAFLLHSNADLDCAGASAALALFYGDSVLCAPAGVSHLGKRLLDAVGLQAEEGLAGADGRTVIVADAQDDSSLGYAWTGWRDAIIIDHHRGSGRCLARVSLVDDSASSCCELAWEAMGRPGKVDKNVGLCLMAGLLSDTGYLRRGGHRTLMAAAEILKASGLDMEDLQQVFEGAEDQDISRRISRIKGAQRLRFDRTGDWIVAVSTTGAFESAVCQAMLATGADVAFAGSQRDDSFRITGRASRQAVDSGIRLGEMFGRIASECGGEGGGHDGAAGFTGEGEAEAMLSICMQGALEALRGKPRGRPDRKPIIPSCD